MTKENKSRKKKKRHSNKMLSKKYTKALNIMEEMIMNIMIELDEDCDKITKDFPVLKPTIMHYQASINEELTWFYDELTVILLNSRGNGNSHNYSSLEDYILGPKVTSGNSNKLPAKKRGKKAHPIIVCAPKSQNTLKIFGNLGEGKKLFEEMEK